MITKEKLAELQAEARITSRRRRRLVEEHGDDLSAWRAERARAIRRPHRRRPARSSSRSAPRRTTSRLSRRRRKSAQAIGGGLDGRAGPLKPTSG